MAACMRTPKLWRVLVQQLQAMRRLNQTEECIACFDEMLFYGVKPTTKAYDGEEEIERAGSTANITTTIITITTTTRLCCLHIAHFRGCPERLGRHRLSRAIPLPLQGLVLPQDLPPVAIP